MDSDDSQQMYARLASLTDKRPSLPRVRTTKESTKDQFQIRFRDTWQEK